MFSIPFGALAQTPYGVCPTGVLCPHQELPSEGDRSDWVLSDKLAKSGLNDPPSQEDLDAIAELHHVLDDDQNGAVDSLESEDVSMTLLMFKGCALLTCFSQIYC